MLRKLKLPLAISISLVFDLQTAPQGEIVSPVYRRGKWRRQGKDFGLLRSSWIFTECINENLPSPNQRSEPRLRRPGWDPQYWDIAGA